MTDIHRHSANIVVVGAGQAGLSLCDHLRKQGHTGSITLVGAERHLPYQRPPLSKAYMLGEFEQSRLMLRPPSYYDKNSISVITRTRIDFIDRDRQAVYTSSGRELPYDFLAITTGASPRRLPESVGGIPSLETRLRSIEDSDRLAKLCTEGARMLVIGGGYIGLEVSACARSRGAAVVLAEAEPRILSRVAGEEIATRIDMLHRDHGVTLHCSTSVTNLSNAPDDTIQAAFCDGTTETADVVLAGVGAIPNTELAERSDLAVDNGIAVDEYCRTSDPRIFAAGDCTSFPFRGSRVRLESVQNAIDQAAAAADSMLGGNTPYRPVPWFWSDQYDMHLQIAGLSLGYNKTAIRPGSTSRSCSVWYYNDAKLLAVDAIDDPKAYIVAKRLLEGGVSPEPGLVCDPSVNLKTLLQSQPGQ